MKELLIAVSSATTERLLIESERNISANDEFTGDESCHEKFRALLIQARFRQTAFSNLLKPHDTEKISMAPAPLQISHLN